MVSLGHITNPFSRDLIPFALIIAPFSRDLITFARNSNPFSRDLIPFARIINTCYEILHGILFAKIKKYVFPKDTTVESRDILLCHVCVMCFVMHSELLVIFMNIKFHKLKVPNCIHSEYPVKSMPFLTLILLKFYRCLLHGLKVCMCFSQVHVN